MLHLTYLTLAAAAATAFFPAPAAAAAVSQRALAKVGHVDSGLDFCWRTKYHRGVGKLPGTCPAGYPDWCGTVGLRPQCCAPCPDPEDGFNPGVRKGKKRFCEYTPAGGGRDKQVYTEYTNAVCGEDKPEEKAGLCYAACDDGYAAGGASLTECWGEPPQHLDYGWIKCGLGAARNAGVCVTQVGEALMGALESALFIVSLGTSAMGSTAVKATTAGGKVVDTADAAADAIKAVGAVADASKAADTVATATAVMKAADALKAARKAADAAAESASVFAKLKKFGMSAMKFMDPIEAGAMAGKRIRKALGLVDKVSDTAGAVADSVKAAKEVVDQVGYCRQFVNFVDDSFSISRTLDVSAQAALLAGDTADKLQALKTLHKQLGRLKQIAAPLAETIEEEVNGYASLLESGVGDGERSRRAMPDDRSFANPEFGKSVCFLSYGVAAADDLVEMLDEPGLRAAWEAYRPTCEQNDQELIQSEEETAEAESDEARRLEKVAEEVSEQVQEGPGLLRGPVQTTRGAGSVTTTTKTDRSGTVTVTTVVTIPPNDGSPVESPVEAPGTSLLETLAERKKKDHCALAEALDAEEEAEIDDELAEELAEFAPTAQGSKAIAQVEREWNRVKNWVDEGVTKRVWATERLRKKVKVLEEFNEKLIAQGKASLVDQDKLAKAEAATAASTDQFLVDPFAAARTAIGLASILDPTGISSNVAAYLYPNCCMYSAEGPEIGCKRVKGMDKKIERKLARQEKKEARKAKRAETKGCKQKLKSAKKDARQQKRIARLEEKNPEKLERVKKRQMARSERREKKELKKLERDLAKGQKKQEKHAEKVLKREEKEAKKAARQDRKAAKKLERQESKQSRKNAKTAKKQAKRDAKYDKQEARDAKKAQKQADKQEAREEKEAAKAAKKSAKADKKAAKKSAKADKKAAKAAKKARRKRRL